jgi:DNA helicase-2/ATP-dependent DNA helicase PcrA
MPRQYVIRRGPAPGYRVNYERDLDPQQFAVVTAPECPALVLAGAGSGKTRTVTYRVARLLEAGVNPSRILLVTFTNKAAREMLGRVDSLVSTDARRVWGGTFHSIANRILRRHAELLGYRSNFTILDTEDAKDLIDASLAESGIDLKARRFPQSEVLADIFSLTLNRGLDLEAGIAEHYPQFQPLAAQIELIRAIYGERKLARNAMDYDDLLVNWKRVLSEHDEIKHYWSDQFVHVLVDEYQDTNRLQADVVDLLASRHRNVMVVGDDAQAIFGWRGADFANIYSFKQRYPDAHEFRLEMNYRSRPEILMVANASIRNNVRQFPKNLKPARTEAASAPGLVPLRDVDQQASFVASRVLELREEGVPLSEIGILYRSHWQALELQLELVRRDVPYVIRSGIRFFEQAHIKDVISYLRIVLNPRDELAWKRSLRMIPGVGKARVNRIWKSLATMDDPLVQVRELDGRTRPRHQGAWQRYLQLLEALTISPNRAAPALQIGLVLESGYQEFLETAYKNPELRLEDLRQLARFAERFESTEEFLSELALISTERFGAGQGAVGEDIIAGSDEDERLALSTIHQAKGLEWKIVFLIWAADGKFPSDRSLRADDKLEEERRLFYVAATRAKDEFYVSYPLVVAGYGGRLVIQKPSRFITEVPCELFEIWSVDEEHPEPGVILESGTLIN